ncbi:IS3 family transposase [Marinobacter sp. F4206]|uniref:IS3 family transposase n=1 Tax=Marinobacter sp. F4206 TaxID=2861777 RepID=UPI001C5EB211|nr:IS3 family transposase [Marinobacter sp. F4206]
MSRIREIHDDSRAIIDSPRIQEDLIAEGSSTGLNRVGKMMIMHGIQGRPRKRESSFFAWSSTRSES